MSRIIKTLLSTTVLGNFENRENEFHIRLWGDEHPQGGKYWIDFEVYDVEGYEIGREAERVFQKKGETSNFPGTTNLDEAEPVAHGFVKWDGCTQFNMDVHIDHVKHLEGLFNAVLEARRLAAEAMPGKMINDDYGAPVPLDEPLRPTLTVTAIDPKSGIITLK